MSAMAEAQKKIRGKVIVNFWSCAVNDLNCTRKHVILWEEIAASSFLECTASNFYTDTRSKFKTQKMKFWKGR